MPYLETSVPDVGDSGTMLKNVPPHRERPEPVRAQVKAWAKVQMPQRAKGKAFAITATSLAIPKPIAGSATRKELAKAVIKQRPMVSTKKRRVSVFLHLFVLPIVSGARPAYPAYIVFVARSRCDIALLCNA